MCKDGSAATDTDSFSATFGWSFLEIMSDDKMWQNKSWYIWRLNHLHPFACSLFLLTLAYISTQKSTTTQIYLYFISCDCIIIYNFTNSFCHFWYFLFREIMSEGQMWQNKSWYIWRLNHFHPFACTLFFTYIGLYLHIVKYEHTNICNIILYILLYYIYYIYYYIYYI